MKKVLKILGVLIIIGLIANFFKDDSKNDKKETSTEEVEEKLYVEIEDIGYFKSADKFRCFTFSVENTLNMDTADIISQLKSHAKKQYHTSGASTAVFYYKRKGGVNLPNPTLQSSYFDALNYCIDKNPFLHSYGVTRPDGTFVWIETGD